MTYTSRVLGAGTSGSHSSRLGGQRCWTQPCGPTACQYAAKNDRSLVENHLVSSISATEPLGRMYVTDPLSLSDIHKNTDMFIGATGIWLGHVGPGFLVAHTY